MSKNGNGLRKQMGDMAISMLRAANKIESERLFSFRTDDDDGNPIVYEKTESELTEQEESLLMGELLQKWNNNTNKNRLEFIDMALHHLKLQGLR